MRRILFSSNLMIGLIFVLTLGAISELFVSLTEAQTGGGNMTGGGNVTSPEATAKADFDLGMKALKGQNVTAAISHFNAATDSLANTTEDSSSAIKSIREGVKLLESGAVGNATSMLGNASQLLK
jgi:hypothetical protein